jgi:hypothetical protein
MCWVSPIKKCETNNEGFFVYWIPTIFLLIFSNRVRFWGSGSLVESKWCQYVMVEADSYLKLLPTFMLVMNKISWLRLWVTSNYISHPYQIHIKVFAHINMLSMIGIQQQAYTVIPTLLGSDFGVLGHLWSQNDAICRNWGWQTHQTAFPIHIGHIQSVWANWYVVNWHIAAALHRYTHPTRISVWGSGSLLESRWCQYVVVEADRHLKLLPTSTLDIYQVFEHIDRLSIGIQQHPYTVIPTLLGSDFGVLGHLWSQNDAICRNWGWQTHQTASPIHIGHIPSVWAHWYVVNWHTAAALHSYTHPTRISVWGSGSLVESRWCQYAVVEADRHLKLLPTSTLDIYQVFEHIDRLSIGIQHHPYTVIPTLLGSDFGVLGHLWSQNHFITSCWLRLTATSNSFPHPH